MPTHRHSVGGKYTSYINVAIPEPQFTAAEVKALKLLIATGGGGGTTPLPPNDPPPPDVTAPNFTAIVFGSPSQTSVAFTWTTDEAAKVRARYGTTIAYGSTTALSGSLATSGGDTITGLTAGTTYHIQLEAQDAAGNIRLSSDRVIVTAGVVVPPPPPDPDTNAPIVSNVVITVTGQTTATVSWNTNEAATGIVAYGSSIAYGSTTAPTSSGTSHSRNLTGLIAGSTYHVQIRATDTAGNLRLDQDRTLTTTPIPPSGGTFRVTSWSAFLNALRDTSKRDITIADATYAIPWTDINAALYPGYARTAATSVVIRTDTPGGVTLDLGGSGSPHLWFRNGTAYQTWPWLKFANSHPGNNGVIQYGEGNGTPVHHLTFEKIELLSSITVAAGPGPNPYTNGQGLYFSWASGGGNHHIVVNELVSNAELWAPIHIYHDEMDGPGHDISVLGGTINCTGSHGQMGIVAYSAEIAGYLFQDIDINGANEYGVYHRHGGTMTFRRVTTTGSGVAGFNSNLGSYPSVPGITFDTCSFG